jgi:hypothetical protein
MVAEVATVPLQPTPAPAGDATQPLPHGWEIAEYPGRGGRTMFAVYAEGRRMASGMTTFQSARRWAHLLASAQ